VGVKDRGVQTGGKKEVGQIKGKFCQRRGVTMRVKTGHNRGEGKNGWGGKPGMQ